MKNNELRDLLVKVEDMRWNESLTSDDLESIIKILKGELDRKKTRQTGPAKGQKYWVAQVRTPGFDAHTESYTYDAHPTVLNVCEFRDIYPEERFAEAELRARKLIQAVNKRRRELNEGKEFGDRKSYIGFGAFSGLDVWDASYVANTPGLAYPFGLFKDFSDCEMCAHEFEGELEWFYEEYIPLMEELDDYDWADAPGWDGVSSDD